MTVDGTHVSGGKNSGLFVRLIRTVYSAVTAPLRAFQAVRQAMTPASVSVLLFGIVTLNIIWGFPWTGLFSACVGMFVAGCMIHFITLPSLNSSYSLPSSAPKGNRSVSRSMPRTKACYQPSISVLVLHNPSCVENGGFVDFQINQSHTPCSKLPSKACFWAPVILQPSTQF